MLLKAVIERFLACYPSLSPSFIGLYSERPFLLAPDNVSALILGFWGNADVEAVGGWARWGADLVLLRGFKSCEEVGEETRL